MGLTRADWIDAALEALKSDGLTAVAVEPIARRIGATKGSFYWHFTDRADLIRGMLDLWERRDTDDVIAEMEAIGDPRKALAALMRFATGASATGEDAGVRLMAVATDPLVEPALTRVTQRRLAFVERLYRDLGLPPAEAARHARLGYALYLGTGDLRRVLPHSELPQTELEAYLDIALTALFAAAQVDSSNS